MVCRMMPKLFLYINPPSLIIGLLISFVCDVFCTSRMLPQSNDHVVSNNCKLSISCMTHMGAAHVTLSPK